VESDDGARGVLIALNAGWESSVLSKPVAKVSWFAADDFETASFLANSVFKHARAAGVVLLSATPGHAPSYLHVSLTEAGFHLGSQTLMVRADLKKIAAAVARIPLRGVFREATKDDADAIATLARGGFVDARFTGDPLFPKPWGQELFADWARNLVLGGADSVVVAEAKNSIVGFVSMTRDATRRATVPPLLAIDQRYRGWGIGAMLVRKMFDWYRQQGVDVLIGATEKSNIAINALYLQLGVTLVDSNIVYHATPVAQQETHDHFL
jgi:GNAT superfamily N-acetyltransferase